jgi:CRP/FNR family transcriptional regulator, cyclic AMP receptor protein
MAAGLDRAQRAGIELALRGSSVFSALDGPAITALADAGVRKAWPGGAVLFQRGDAGEYLLAVITGKVRLSFSTPEGKELVLGHVGPGQVLGEFAVIDGQPRSADATALEPTSGILVQRDSFLRVVSARADLGLALARHLSLLLRATNYQMESIALYDLQARVARFILASLRREHGPKIPAEARLSLGLNQTELAAVLGASRPKVNQVLQVLLGDGTLRRDGADLICVRTRLEDAAGLAAPDRAG